MESIGHSNKALSNCDIINLFTRFCCQYLPSHSKEQQYPETVKMTYFCSKYGSKSGEKK